jgi:hypothetical protein
VLYMLILFLDLKFWCTAMYWHESLLTTPFASYFKFPSRQRSHMLMYLFRWPWIRKTPAMALPLPLVSKDGPLIFGPFGTNRRPNRFLGELIPRLRQIWLTDRCSFLDTRYFLNTEVPNRMVRYNWMPSPIYDAYWGLPFAHWHDFTKIFLPADGRKGDSRASSRRLQCLLATNPSQAVHPGNSTANPTIKLS